ncbi:MAG: hypothetical protein M5U28_23020 [Sandaracinaceae bacterium]|nr:hypothetical protein [Sandaracinaceae bacterium]
MEPRIEEREVDPDPVHRRDGHLIPERLDLEPRVGPLRDLEHRERLAIAVELGAGQ